MFGSTEPADHFQSQIISMVDGFADGFCPSRDENIVNGYKTIYRTVAEKFLLSGVGRLELLLWASGTPAAQEQTLNIHAALQHPFSQGLMYINSSDPFDYPVIDPQYLPHWADVVSLRENIKLVRLLDNPSL